MKNQHTNFVILGVDVLGASYKAVAEMLGRSSTDGI